jgi:hypothetical protein
MSMEESYAAIRAHLSSRRRALAEEIGRHPRPITACDVHFNRLLEERAALAGELDRLDALIESSAVLTPEAKARLLGSQAPRTRPTMSSP